RVRSSKGSASSVGSRRIGREFHALGHGRVGVACDAADGAARELCGVQLVGAKQFPAVAVPRAGLFLHSTLWLNDRVEHDHRSAYAANAVTTVGSRRAPSANTPAIT